VRTVRFLDAKDRFQTNPAGEMMASEPRKELVAVMEAVRCTQCGETRWSLFPGSLAHALEAPCELCGGETVIERRRPGSGPRELDVERRRAGIAGRIAGGDSARLTAH
jgi:hypothetical protein